MLTGFAVLVEGLDIFMLKDVAASGGKISHWAICPLRKELWLYRCLGSEPRKVVITLAQGL
jgi:hypothetical protein